MIKMLTVCRSNGVYEIEQLNLIVIFHALRSFKSLEGT